MHDQLALILFSHGSLLCGSGKLLHVHADWLKNHCDFVAVEPGYLNYCSPSIEEAVKSCMDAGAAEIVVVPYFLVAGKFVQEDLPRRLADVKERFPHVRFIMAGPLGNSPFMKAAVVERVKDAAQPREWQARAIEQALGQCELRRDCPLYATEMCRADTGKSEAQGEESKVASGGNDGRQKLAEVAPGGGGVGDSLVLVLHGSPRVEANEPALRMAEALRSNGRYQYVTVAYLECNKPSIPEALAECADMGAGRVVVVPYFLHTGRHLVLDIPRLLLEAQVRHPLMQILMTDAAGNSSNVAKALLQRAREAVE